MAWKFAIDVLLASFTGGVVSALFEPRGRGMVKRAALFSSAGPCSCAPRMLGRSSCFPGLGLQLVATPLM